MPGVTISLYLLAISVVALVYFYYSTKIILYVVVIGFLRWLGGNMKVDKKTEEDTPVEQISFTPSVPLCFGGYMNQEGADTPEHYSGKDCTDTLGKCPCEYSTDLDHQRVPADGTLQFNTKDFYGFSQCERNIKVVASTVEKFGIGTCGPRAFYGTMKPHVEFETLFSSWMGTESAISYPSYSSLPLSIVAAFMSNKTLPPLPQGKSFHSEHLNFVLVDKGCNPVLKFAVRKFCGGSYIEFAHNDRGSLEECLTRLENEWVSGRNPSKYSCFVLLEGIYESTGLLCDLRNISLVCKTPRKRLPNVHMILDDTLAVGILGGSLKGSWEHWGLHTDDFYLLYCGLDSVMGSSGGVCYGNENLINYQRTGGSGYTFSASLPALFAAAASSSVAILQEEQAQVMRARLTSHTKVLRGSLVQHQGLNTEFSILYDEQTPESPIIILVPHSQDVRRFEQLVRVLNEHYGISLFFSDPKSSELSEPLALRIFVNTLSSGSCGWGNKIAEAVFVCYNTIPSATDCDNELLAQARENIISLHRSGQRCHAGR